MHCFPADHTRVSGSIVSNCTLHPGHLDRLHCLYNASLPKCPWEAPLMVTSPTASSVHIQYSAGTRKCVSLVTVNQFYVRPPYLASSATVHSVYVTLEKETLATTADALSYKYCHGCQYKNCECNREPRTENYLQLGHQLTSALELVLF